MIVNSSQGGGSKDTWIVEEGAPPHAAPGVGRGGAAADEGGVGRG